MSPEACPRCGRPGYAEVHKRGSRRYVYVCHVEGGRRVKHYVGPLEEYSYVEGFHDLGLTNVAAQDYVEPLRRAFERALERLAKLEADGRSAEARALRERLRATLRWMLLHVAP